MVNLQRVNRKVAELDAKYTDNRLSHKLLEEEEDNIQCTLANIKRAQAAEKKVADDETVIIVSDEETE